MSIAEVLIQTLAYLTCRSQAEQLARLLPQSYVVKSFNVLSAYSLESGGLQGSKQVREKRVLMGLMI